MSAPALTTRLTRAVEIRDHLLPLIHANGVPKVRAKQRWTELVLSGFTFVLTTPLTPLPANPPPGSYEHALAQRLAKKILPWRLDIWNRSGKVLSLRWDDERAELISMKPGPWEAALLTMA